MLVLVDPPVTECIQKSNETVTLRHLNNGPYQYGYVDFTPWEDVHVGAFLSQQSGPSRQCVYDDIYFYLTHPVREHLAPDIPAMIIQKLVLSNNIAFIEFLKAIISRLEMQIVLSKDIKNYAWLADTMSELFAWKRRPVIIESCEESEAALDDLHIPINPADEEQPTDGNDSCNQCHNDFRYVC